MNDDTRDAIIDDILKKYPVGPAGTPKLEYLFVDEYNYTRGQYENIKKCSDLNHGYTDATLFSLGFRDQGAVKSYIMNRWFKGETTYSIGGQKSTVTRRSNRIWARISDAVCRQRAAGGKGIYRIGRDYRTSEMGYVYSSNTEEAQTMANMFFPIEADCNYTVTFVEIGSVDRLYHYNAKVREEYESQIDRQQRAIEDCTRRIEKYTNVMTMLTVLEGHQVAVETEI